MKNIIRALLPLMIVLFCFIRTQAQNITQVGVYPSPNALNCVDVSGNYAYVGGAFNGMKIINVTDIYYPSFDTILEFNEPTWNIKTLNNVAHLVGSDNYRTVNIIDPHNPATLDTIWTYRLRDIYISNSYSYTILVAPSGGETFLRIYDISDPSDLTIAGTLQIGSLWENSISSIVLIDTLALTVGAKLQIFNVVDPASVYIVSATEPPDSTDGFYDIYVKDSYAFITSANRGLLIYDISNPAIPSLVAEHETIGIPSAIRGDTSFVYVAGNAALSIFDISNALNPELAGLYSIIAGLNSISVRDSLLFVCAGASGLHILNFSPGKGSITCNVRDSQTHQPIEGAVVWAEPDHKVDTSDASGTCFLSDLYNTYYNIYCSHPDYFDTTYYDIEIVANDTALLVINMQHYPPPDVGVSAVICSDEVLGGVDYRIRAAIFNNSSQAGPFDVILEISIQDSSRIVLTDTYPMALMNGFSADTIEFATTLPAITGEHYAIKAYTSLATDTNPANDTSIIYRQVLPACYLIFGNRDGSLIEAEIGTTLELPVWGVTPAGSPDSVVHMSIPLQYTDEIKGQMLDGVFPDTLVGRWDERYFTETNWWTPEDGYHWSQTMVATAYISDPRDPENFFRTDGDTVLIATFRLVIKNDTDLIGDTLSPFSLGNSEMFGGLHWDMQSGNVTVPVATYPRVLFLPASRCVYRPGDVNGNGVTNGIDIGYAVGYFKGGPHPPVDCGTPVGPCPQASPFYAGGDTNGDCVFNGIDITFFVNYLKGIQPAIRFCPSCPPAE